MTRDTALTSAQLRTLKRLFPGDALSVAPEELLVFGTDASRRQGRASAVVRPESTEQAAELLAFAHAERIPIYPRGRGTSRVGGCVPVTPGIVVSMARMRAIEDISESDFVAVVQPGVATGDLQQACRNKGLFYPPDPASAGFSSIGGNLATNAGGMLAVKYGVTRDYVLGLEVVLPGGEIVRPGSRCHKDVAGLDFTRLFVGSEGTLGLITRATLKVLPLPEAQASLLVLFADEKYALDAVGAVFQARVLPVALEFLPGEALKALAGLGPVPWPQNTGAALLLRLDGGAQGVAADLDRLEKALAPHRPTALEKARTPESEDALWELRRQVSQAAFTLAPDKFSEDIAVPRGQVGRAVAGLRDIGRSLGVTVMAFGHLGDGNLHVNVLHDATVPGQAAAAGKAKQAVLELALSLGGTISGEHGVGLTKLDWLPRQTGAALQNLMRGVKAVFDPCGIMNPGKAY
ncbi:FAD-linked oxidase C-terminal domain-containing protein [Fundidesulfovibrio butyratiphilus]